jgi:hypothetical protein
MLTQEPQQRPIANAVVTGKHGSRCASHILVQYLHNQVGPEPPFDSLWNEGRALGTPTGVRQGVPVEPAQSHSLPMGFE